MVKMDRRYIAGDRWVRCDECSFGYRFSQMRKGVSLRQKGFHVCPTCFDTRHPNTDWRLSPKTEGKLIGGNIGAPEGTQPATPPGTTSEVTFDGEKVTWQGSYDVEW
jgi:hypothetical protein